MKVGTIVKPVGPVAGEVIVGIVTGKGINGYPEVMWMSDRRGVFVCVEAQGDLTLARLDLAGEGSDRKLDGADVARWLVAGATA